MKKRKIYIITAVMVNVLMLSACSGEATDSTVNTSVDSEEAGEEHVNDTDEHADEDEHTGGDEHAEDDDHMEGEHVHVEAPAEFADLSNPFAEDHEAAEAGAVLFATNCAACHGDEGKGDGPAAEGLDPKPASLSDSAMIADLSDAYLFWRITEGGAMEPFNSAMPPWSSVLTEDERWQLVTYLRELSEDGHD